MTTDLEKRFFDTFGIEKIIPCYKCNMQNTNWDCKRICLYDDEKRKEYPQITDSILLELICIIHQASLESYGEEYYFESVNYKELKKEVIAKCKRLADKNAFSEVTGEHIKHQVQALFKER